jgi:hypothetical protein
VGAFGGGQGAVAVGGTHHAVVFFPGASVGCVRLPPQHERAVPAGLES